MYTGPGFEAKLKSVVETSTHLYLRKDGSFQPLSKDSNSAMKSLKDMHYILLRFVYQSVVWPVKQENSMIHLTDIFLWYSLICNLHHPIPLLQVCQEHEMALISNNIEVDAENLHATQH